MSYQQSCLCNPSERAAFRSPMDVMGKVADVLTGSGKGLKDLALEDGGGRCLRFQHTHVQLSFQRTAGVGPML